MEYVNRCWFETKNMIELTKYLQSSDAEALTRKTAIKIVNMKGHKIRVGRAVDLFLVKWIETAKDFIAELYDVLKDDIKKHSYNLPLIFWPDKGYMSFQGRIKHENFLKFMRSIPGISKYLTPKKIVDPIPRVILPGVDYSAESLVFTGCLKSKGCNFDKSKLEWMHKDARADYALDVVCFGSEDFETLTRVWFYGEMDYIHAYVEALSTLIEEALHHMVDQLVRVSRYGKGDAKEHYWMNAYGDFPEKVYDAIEEYGEKYVGIVKKRVL